MSKLYPTELNKNYKGQISANKAGCGKKVGTAEIVQICKCAN